MSLAILLATRNRPELLLYTIRTTTRNMRRDDTKLVIAVDDDDQATIDMLNRGMFLSRNVVVSIKPREDTLGEKYNRILDYEADVYLAMVDYAPHITPGFDNKIVDAAMKFPDGIGFVFNHLANLSFPQINAMTRKTAEMMGYFYPPYFPHWFVDHWLDDIARITDRIVFTDVWIDTNRRPGTMEQREVDFWATFFDATKFMRRRIAHNIIKSKANKHPHWHKAVLLMNHPLIEERSVMVNNNARALFEGTPGEAPDERYLRAKAKAIEVLRGCIGDLEAEEAETRARAA